MSDGPFVSSHTGDRTGSLLSCLARRALVEVHARHGGTPLQADARHIATLYAAACAPSNDGPRSLLRALQGSRVRPETVMDNYIPTVARMLGDAWVADEMTFAEVTIAASRLQALLRELSPKREECATADLDRPEVAVVIPENEDHTLGGMVLTGQLRRMGVSVRLYAGEPDIAVFRDLSRRNPDAMLISAAHGERLSRLRAMVDSLRDAVELPTPIVIGGAVLVTAENVRQRTGADFALSDAREALIACAVLHPQTGAVARPRARARTPAAAVSASASALR